MSRLFQNLWTAEIPRALCLTFLHSLWQGLLLALLAALIILLSPKAKPRIRYNMLAFLFAGFAITVSLTFILSFRHGSRGSLTFLYAAGSSTGAALPYALWNNTLSFINAHAGSLIVVWLMAFSLKSFRLLQDLSGLNLLRKTGTPVNDPYWTGRLQELKSKLQISGLVRLSESALLKSPSVSGILKPVILLPLGLLSQLPADQVEAILLHELAHIRRKDYLFNLVQTFLETIFFFNPFIGWISATLRRERENCCDEIAIEVNQNKAALVRALLSFGEQQIVQGNFAMALGSKKTMLLDRVRRITCNKNKSLNGAEKSFLALFSLAILAFLFTFSWNVQLLNGKTNKPYNQLLEQQVPTEENIPKEQQPADFKNKTNKQCLSGTIQPSAIRNLSRTQIQSATITTVNNSPGTDTLALNRNILTDIEKEGILSEERVLSYRLNDDELVVNGVKQPESLHQKLKSKYVTCPGWAILYDFHTCS